MEEWPTTHCTRPESRYDRPVARLSGEHCGTGCSLLSAGTQRRTGYLPHPATMPAPIRSLPTRVSNRAAIEYLVRRPRLHRACPLPMLDRLQPTKPRCPSRSARLPPVTGRSPSQVKRSQVAGHPVPRPRPRRTRCRRTRGFDELRRHAIAATTSCLRTATCQLVTHGKLQRTVSVDRIAYELYYQTISNENYIVFSDSGPCPGPAPVTRPSFTGQVTAAPA